MEEFEFQYYAPNQYHHNLIQTGAQQGQQFVQQYQKASDSRCSKAAAGHGQPMVYSMDRMSPYYQEDSRSTNLSNLTLDQIFKSNQSDDQPNIVVVNSNDSLLLFQQANSGQQAAASASPSNTSMSSSSSPQSSSSPSSTNDANSNYVESMQLMECGIGQQQQQQQGQMQQQSHHQGPTLVSLVPASASSMNPLLNPMMSLASPSKPSTVSELSNSSMVSSSSSSTLDSSQFRGSTSGTRTRTRNTSTKPVNDQQKDGKYFERRKRNNVAAKKSRDARKQREDEIAIRASFLEKENSILKAQLQTLKDEAQQLRILLTQKKANQSMGGLMTASCASCSNCMGKQVAQTYVANLNPINNGFESETAINMVDQKMSTTAGQQNATNSTGMYLGQANHGQQLNRLL